MGKVIDFKAAAGTKEAAAFEAVNDPIKPIIEAMQEMNPGDLSDFCRAVCQSMEYISRTKKYRYFSNSTDLALLIGSNYVYTVKGYNPPTDQERKAAAPAPAVKRR